MFLRLHLNKYWNFVCWLLFGIISGLILATFINFQNLLSDQLSNQLPGRNFLPSGVFDNFTISALTDISQLIPANETVVVSDHAPLSEYFVKHHMTIPRGKKSENTQIEYMSKNNYKYLMVYVGASEEQGLKSLFNVGGLEKLNDDYYEIANYVTRYSIINVYERKG
jgi:hypothetical protein